MVFSSAWLSVSLLMWGGGGGAARLSGALEKLSIGRNLTAAVCLIGLV